MTQITDFLSDIPKDFTPEMRAAAVEVVAQRALYLLDLALAQHDADYGKFKPTFSPTHWTHGARKIFAGVERFSPEARARLSIAPRAVRMTGKTYDGEVFGRAHMWERLEDWAERGWELVCVYPREATRPDVLQAVFKRVRSIEEREEKNSG